MPPENGPYAVLDIRGDATAWDPPWIRHGAHGGQSGIGVGPAGAHFRAGVAEHTRAVLLGRGESMESLI